MKPLELGGTPLALEEVSEVVFLKRKVLLSENAIQKIKKSQAYLLSEVQSGKTIYGVNTGFGLLSNVKIENHKIEELQYRLIRSHAVGVGNYLEDKYVRAILLLRANALALGYSGVSLGLIEQLIAFLNHEISPLIPEQGSVGASGDLAPLAHLALVLIGEGRARVSGKECTGAEALRKAELKPLKLGPKEGLALVNGTQFMTGLGTLALLDAEYLCNMASYSGAMSVEALRGSTGPFESEIHEVRAHPGQVRAAKHLRTLLGSGSEIAKSHKTCTKVQDPYSLRCIPQVHGASWDVLQYVRSILEREINSVTDNPIVFSEKKKILSGGNFHGQTIAMAMDFLAIAVAEIASISEQRIEKLMNPVISELPAFLAPEGGLNSGFMIVQVAAASLVSENKTLCHPASVDSIPTSADKEDHVSMGAWAARKALQVVTNSRRVLAMEFLSAAQGIDFLRPLRSTAEIEKIHAKIRSKIPKLEQDRSMHEDLLCMEDLLREQKLDVG